MSVKKDNFHLTKEQFAELKNCLKNPSEEMFRRRNEFLKDVSTFKFKKNENGSLSVEIPNLEISFDEDNQRIEKH